MIEKVLIVSLFSYGWCALFWEDQVFDKVGDWVEEHLPEYIYKPLIGCPICNSFWVGTLMYWLLWGNDWVTWLMICTCAIGLNAIIVNIINKIEDISEKIHTDGDIKK